MADLGVPHRRGRVVEQEMRADVFCIYCGYHFNVGHAPNCKFSNGATAPVDVPAPPLTITTDEAREIYEFTRDAYLDPNRWRHLYRLLDRIDEHLELGKQRLEGVS